MSGLLFMGGGIALGLGAAVAFQAVSHYIGPPITRLHRRWLERRLSLRLARGSDRYFEERRSIESSLARSDGPSPPVTRIDWMVRIAMIPLLGLLALSWWLPDDQVPGWVHLLPDGILILVGVQLAWAAYAPTAELKRSNRIWGIAAIFVFSALLIWDLSKLGGAS